MDELYELIKHQASYTELVAWIQRHEHCEYLQACLRANAILKQYRRRYTACDPAV